ncbi:MAG: hypothetical protein ACFFDT_09805, partial [Candidatus Hodarchaeota archaeon]
CFFPNEWRRSAMGRLTTICTRRQEQGIVMLGALRGVFGFDSWAKSALVKWNVRASVEAGSRRGSCLHNAVTNLLFNSP